MRPGTAGAYLLASLLLTAPLSAAPGALLVHLPSVPLESSTRLATAVTALRDYMSAEVPGFVVDVKIFRRWEDADAFYQKDPSAIVAVLSEASFLFDLPAEEGFVPVWRFYREGSETYRQVLVVRTEDQALSALGDLRGHSLQYVKTTGGHTLSFLARAVFAGEVSPQDWFGSLEAAPDDFSAVASVLHGQVDAALVADYNPLLRSQLGDKLRTLFTSPPLSLPVIALRSQALGAQQRATLDQAMATIGENAEGRKVLEELGLDGLRPIEDGGGRFDREALLRIPSVQKKTMEIALPSSLPANAAGSSELTPADVTFSLALELPEIAPATELSSVRKTPR